MEKSVPKSNGTSTSKENKKVSSKIDFRIVGIGASAGGLEALDQLFENMPPDSGMAFVVIQHLDPNYVGILPELLQRATEMKVKQAKDHMEIEPNHVYVIPPNKSMSVLNGVLYLFEPVELRGLRLPIDFFFRSLAEDQKQNSIGIILSGMGSDGSQGLKAISEKNGVCVVQEPSSAKFNGMPIGAMGTVNADIVAKAIEIPLKLIETITNNVSIAKKKNIDLRSTTNLQKIILLIRSRTGHDFSLYKNNTLFRRIERRMNVHQIEKIANYVRFIQENPSELDILFKELLIGVTNFFRDTQVWDKLKSDVLPDFFNKLPDGYVIRAWVTGCSTGEEAYSLAIIFKEVIENIEGGRKLSFQIFASDIDSDSIEIARKGFFSPRIIDHVSKERLNLFFTKEKKGFRVNSSIREMIVFAPHNVIKDPPFTKLDLLFCRNLLIYMEAELQKKLMNLFHYTLNSEGLMVLGSAENENSQKNHFICLDSKLKIYKHSPISEKSLLLDFPDSFTQSTKQIAKKLQPVKVSDNIQTLADQLLLQNYAPASVLINGDGDILYITGRTGKYLEPAAGKVNWNIYAMAREGLSSELPGAIRKAKKNYEQITLSNIKVGINGGTQIIHLTLQQVEKPETIKGTIMIVFKDVDKIDTSNKLRTKKVIRKDATTREQELELELQRAVEELQSTHEEMQTTQEELKSTNEEMQSTNEELQSTNEELTTSKEEMQSLNEELQTVNVELQSKIVDLMSANNDMKNLLNSTDIATLFLDKDLNVRRFTDQLTQLFKLRLSDLGRPFTDLVSQLDYPEMSDHAREVMRTLIFKETSITTVDNKWFRVRIMPYRTHEDHIDGLVVTFIEITTAKNLEDELNKTIALLRKHNIKKS